MRHVLIAVLVALPAAALAQQGAPRTHDFRIGALSATVLEDTGPGDFPIGVVYKETERAAAVLRAAGLPTDKASLQVQPLLVRSGSRIILLDAGNPRARGGRLIEALAAAGVKREAVTDIFISHEHADHWGGLMGEGGRAFPNARLRMHPATFAAIRANTANAAMVAAYTPAFQPIEDGGEIAPGVIAQAIRGHTAGHMGVEITSGGERLIYVADSMHHYVASLADPELTIAFDGNEAVAEASRRALLTRAAAEGTRIHAVHFPFPGLGRVRAKGNGFEWVAQR